MKYRQLEWKKTIVKKMTRIQKFKHISRLIKFRKEVTVIKICHKEVVGIILGQKARRFFRC